MEVLVSPLAQSNLGTCLVLEEEDGDDRNLIERRETTYTPWESLAEIETRLEDV